MKPRIHTPWLIKKEPFKILVVNCSHFFGRALRISRVLDLKDLNLPKDLQ